MFLPVHDANPRKHIRLHYATLSLIAINVLIFFLYEGGIAMPIDAVGLAVLPAAFTGEVVRPEALAMIPEELTLLTYGFLHGDIWHLLGNMLFLWVFGDNVEDAVGHWKFVLFYLLCGVGAGLAQIAVDPDSIYYTIGASGSVAGVVAAYLMLHPRVRIWILVFARIPVRLSAVWVLGAWIAYQLWSAFNAADEAVAWWAHVGGIVTGAVLILFLRRPGVELFDRNLPEAIPAVTRPPSP